MFEDKKLEEFNSLSESLSEFAQLCRERTLTLSETQETLYEEIIRFLTAISDRNDCHQETKNLIAKLLANIIVTVKLVTDLSKKSLEIHDSAFKVENQINRVEDVEKAIESMRSAKISREANSEIYYAIRSFGWVVPLKNTHASVASIQVALIAMTSNRMLNAFLGIGNPDSREEQIEEALTRLGDAFWKDVLGIVVPVPFSGTLKEVINQVSGYTQSNITFNTEALGEYEKLLVLRDSHDVFLIKIQQAKTILDSLETSLDATNKSFEESCNLIISYRR